MTSVARARAGASGIVSVLLAGAVAAAAAAISQPPAGEPQDPGVQAAGTVAPAGAVTVAAARARKARVYPLHTNIVATTFWVGEIFDPNAADGSQMLSTYDDHWYASYGGCDGIRAKGLCQTERRYAANGYFPRHMKPKQNPFYLDLPYDDLNDPVGHRRRAVVIPWARQAPYKRLLKNENASIMKDRWVKIRKGKRVCYGQIQDAGPGRYHDARYVFGDTNARPASKRYNNAGMDVSPALNGCLRFKSLNGDTDRVSWRFVDAVDVPRGPWTRVVTSTRW